jgi:hypothetical protein|nr:hypothetical protein [Dyella sp. ASV24]
MTDGMREPHLSPYEAFNELLRLYRQLERENELLRGQLRRHSAGELQIRETERKMAEIHGAPPSATPDRLMSLLAAWPDEQSAHPGEEESVNHDHHPSR